MASATYVDGSTSKYLGGMLSPRMQERFLLARARREKNGVNVTAELDLIDARMEALVERAEKNVAAGDPQWVDARQFFEEFVEAQAGKDPEAAVAALQKLSAILLRGGEDEKAWSEWRQLSRDRQRLLDSERRWEVLSREMVAVSEVFLGFGFVLSEVRQHVIDQKVVAIIQQAIKRVAPDVELYLPRADADEPEHSEVRRIR